MTTLRACFSSCWQSLVSSAQKKKRDRYFNLSYVPTNIHSNCNIILHPHDLLSQRYQHRIACYIIILSDYYI